MLTAKCVFNAQLQHACEIKYFGSVKIQKARGFKLCRLEVQADNYNTVSEGGLSH
jgi:hypothetical protein